MIWVDADRPAWSSRERQRFEGRSYPAAVRQAEDWGATRLTFENGKQFDRVDGEWVRVNR